MRRESSIEHPCCVLLEQRGWVVLKVGHAGYPDRIALKCERFIWLEFKTATGSLTPAQARRLPKLRKLNQQVLIVDDVDELRTMLDRGYYPFTKGF